MIGQINLQKPLGKDNLFARMLLQCLYVPNVVLFGRPLQCADRPDRNTSLFLEQLIFLYFACCMCQENNVVVRMFLMLYFLSAHYSDWPDLVASPIRNQG